VPSPKIFSIAFEGALKSSPLLSHINSRGDLIAYADDFLIHSSSISELWGLRLNPKKSQFLPKRGSEEEKELPTIDGIQTCL
jgi:hypothetical protein